MSGTPTLVSDVATQNGSGTTNDDLVAVTVAF